MEAIRLVTIATRPRFASRSELEHNMTYRPRLTDRDRTNLIAKLKSDAACGIAQVDRALGRTGPAWLERRAHDDRRAPQPPIEYSRHPGGVVLDVR